MIDCAKDVRAFHNQDVTLPESEQKKMRDRRNANRRRLRNGLTRAGKPAPMDFVKQGSYAMKTMIRDPDNDYDIDDGVYFSKEGLVGARGAEMTSLQARQMVRDAVDNGTFKQAPEVRSNCVRVFYKAGYHVDLPVYRRVVASTIAGDAVHYELAASSGWKRSDARDVSDWYEDERAKSADGQQLRRINRDLKKYARSRHSWRAGMLSGFGISVLVTERFQHHDREDRALYDTMSWPNVSRHPLGASAVGRNKAEALAERLQADLPHLQVEARAYGLHQLLQRDLHLMEEADLIRPPLRRSCHPSFAVAFEHRLAHRAGQGVCLPAAGADAV